MAKLCPHCTMVMGEEEARTGICPVCAGPLPFGPPPEPDSPQPATTPPSRAPFWTVVGGLVTCLLLALLLFLNREKEPIEDDDPEKQQLANREKPQEKEPEKRTTEPPKPTTTPEKKPDPPRPEPKKPDEVKKPDPPKPEPEPILDRARVATLPLLPDDAIKIDGDLADWKAIKPVTLMPLDRGKGAKKAVIIAREQKAYLACCPKGLLVAVDVDDTSGEIENRPAPANGTWPFWDNDAVEVFIDTLNAHPQERGEATLHQFFALPFGTPNDAGTGGYESRIHGTKVKKLKWTIVPLPNTGPNPMLRAGRQRPGGWTMELLIPKTALNRVELTTGKVFGFELQVDTGTGIYYNWACDDPNVRASMHPGFWGEVKVGGSDARIELLEGRRPTVSFVPGRPLTVRVTDLDRNLNPAKKETVSVTLRGLRGDREELTLQETGPSSGVFVGAMPTRLGTGIHADNVVEVLKGETLSVEYLDALRVNGERDRIERSTFRAGR